MCTVRAFAFESHYLRVMSDQYPTRVPGRVQALVSTLLLSQSDRCLAQAKKKMQALGSIHPGLLADQPVTRARKKLHAILEDPGPLGQYGITDYKDYKGKGGGRGVAKNKRNVKPIPVSVLPIQVTPAPEWEEISAWGEGLPLFTYLQPPLGWCSTTSPVSSVMFKDIVWGECCPVWSYMQPCLLCACYCANINAHIESVHSQLKPPNLVSIPSSYVLVDYIDYIDPLRI